MKIRTGIYGGSFNPIHNGHLTLGTYLCDQGWVDELWFMVSPQNPLKENPHELLEDTIRLHWVEMAISGDDRLKASDFEMHLPRPSYMVHTLQQLRTTYPDREFILIIGADNWENFSQWYKHEEILCHHPIYIYPRSGYTIDSKSLPSGVKKVDTPLLDISSTNIRTFIRKNEFDGKDIPTCVWQEIKEGGYYK